MDSYFYSHSSHSTPSHSFPTQSDLCINSRASPAAHPTSSFTFPPPNLNSASSAHRHPSDHLGTPGDEYRRSVSPETRTPSPVPPPARHGHSFHPDTTPSANLPTQATPSTNTASYAAVVSNLFIDNVVKDLGLTHANAVKLRTLALLGSAVVPALSEADLATRVYLLGTVLALIEETKAAVAVRNNGVEDLPALLNDMKIRLDDTFKISKEQNENIRAITYELMFHHTRVKFKTLHSEVESTLEARKNTLRMTNIYGNPAREKVLHNHVKKVASGIRSGFRAEIIDSIFTSDKITDLESFTHTVILKYSPRSTTQLHATYLARNALLRRFAMDNPQLMNVDEPEVDDGSSSSAQAGTPPKKKRKTTVGGRIPEGQDFWSKADAFIDTYVKKWGKNLAAPEWQEFVNQLVAADEQRFPPAMAAWQLAPPTEPVESQTTQSELTRPFTSVPSSAPLGPPRSNGHHLLDLLNPAGGRGA